jgi:hypothetical protein
VRLPFWIARLRLLRPQHPEPMNGVAQTRLTTTTTAPPANTAHAHPPWLIKLHARESWRLLSAATLLASVLT